jgi:hypothetical protein
MRIPAVTILILAMLACLSGCKKKPAPIVITSDIEKNHLQRNHIFGYVKYLDTETYNLQGESITVSDTANIQHLLDICKERCNVSDVSQSRQQYTSDGFLLHFTKFGNDGIAYHRDYTYSDDARIERWQEFNPNREDSLVTFGEYHYDRNRFLVGEKIYQGDSLVMSFMHTTDGVGNIIHTVQSFGKLQTTVDYKFNEDGLVKEIIEYEPDGKVFKTAKIEYDNYGDEVNRCVYKAGNQMIEYTYTQYDQAGRIRKIIYEDKLHHVKEHHYFFNYDSHKNWQTEVCAVDNQIVYVKQRKFTYYNE